MGGQQSQPPRTSRTAEASDVGRTPKVSQTRRRWLMAGGVVLAVTAVVCVWPWMRVNQHLNAARRALDGGDPDAAMTPLLAAEQVQPQRAEVQFLLAVAHRRAGRLDRFRAQLQRARELRWPAEDVQLQEWLAAAQVGEIEAVRSRLLAAVDRHAGDKMAEEICEALARGSLAAYRIQDAVKYLDMWLQWRPEAPQARLLQAYVDERLDRIPAAIEDYRAVLVQLPRHREAHFRLAELLFQQGTLDEAEHHFQACLAANPGDADAWIGTAQCAAGQGHNEAAQLALDQVSALHLTSRQRANALAEQGRIRLQEGKLDEAVKLLTQAVDLTPFEVSMHYSLAAALGRAGRPDQAKLHHDRLRQIASQRDRLGDITRALFEQPNDADLRCEAGMTLLELGLASEGLDWLKTALACVPTHRRSHQTLAEYYAAHGNSALAEQHRLAAHAPDPPRPTTPQPKPRSSKR